MLIGPPVPCVARVFSAALAQGKPRLQVQVAQGILQGMQRKPVKLWFLIRRFRLYWLLVPLLFTVVFGGIGVRDMLIEMALTRDGVTVTGEVTAKQIRRSRSSQQKTETITYWVAYQFRPEGLSEMLTRDRPVSESLYHALEVGGPVAVLYVWSNPDRSTIDRAHDKTGAIVFVVMGGVAAVLTLGLGWWLLGRKLSVIRALLRGEVRQARVTGLRSLNMAINRQDQFRLQWVDAAGDAGESMMAPLSKFAAYPPGSVIVVYVDPRSGRGWWDVQLG
jgi:hypothetical protein